MGEGGSASQGSRCPPAAGRAEAQTGGNRAGGAGAEPPAWSCRGVAPGTIPPPPRAAAPFSADRGNNVGHAPLVTGREIKSPRRLQKILDEFTRALCIFAARFNPKSTISNHTRGPSRALFSSSSSTQTAFLSVHRLESCSAACRIPQPEIILDTQPIISIYLA